MPTHTDGTIDMITWLKETDRPRRGKDALRQGLHPGRRQAPERLARAQAGDEERPGVAVRPRRRAARRGACNSRTRPSKRNLTTPPSSTPSRGCFRAGKPDDASPLR
jgi:hypothetical protein